MLSISTFLFDNFGYDEDESMRKLYCYDVRHSVSRARWRVVMMEELAETVSCVQ